MFERFSIFLALFISFIPIYAFILLSLYFIICFTVKILFVKKYVHIIFIYLNPNDYLTLNVFKQRIDFIFNKQVNQPFLAFYINLFNSRIATF